MFKRIQYEDWQNAISIIAFAIFFVAFIIFVVRAILMKKDKVEHMAHLPLEDDQSNLENNDGQKKEKTRR
jgi:cbb3-type cytochrome oxidase subunit 3